MIEMMISGRTGDAEYIRQRAKDYAARMTEEEWRFYLCEEFAEIEKLLEQNAMLDMVCMDITLQKGLEMAREVRASNGKAYMVLIADTSISPMEYMRPSIRAEGLMMKPLNREQIEGVLKESFRAFLKRFRDNSGQQAFILESRQGRRFVEYDRILYFESRDKKLYLCTETEELVFYDTLENLEIQLPDHFLRCHRGFLVNTHMIEQILLAQNLIRLKSGFQVPISRSYRKIVKELKL